MELIKFIYWILSFVVSIYFFTATSAVVPDIIWKSIWLLSAFIDAHRIYDFVKEGRLNEYISKKRR